LKLLRRYKEGHFILIKETIHQEEITVTNIYAPNEGALNLIKQILQDLWELVYSNIIKVPHSHQYIGHPNNQQRNIKINQQHRSNGLNKYQ
jgi:hypothetical protein